MSAATHMMLATVCILVAVVWFGTEYRASAFLFQPDGQIVLTDKADIKPVDSFVFIGEIIKVQCKLLESTENIRISDVSFKITHHPAYSPGLTSPVNESTWIVPQENVTIVDNRTIYAIIAVTEQFTASATVACINDYDTLISTYVYAERPLQNVTNFTGIYYYDKDNITLTWSLGQTYLEVATNINVTVLWSPNSVPNAASNLCEYQQLESCSVRTSGQDIIIFKVVVSIMEWRNQGRDDPEFLTSLYDTNTSYISKFVLDDNIKTSPPINLRVVEVKKTCAVVTWDHGRYFSFCNCNALFQLKITTNGNETVVVEDVRHVGQQNVSVCNLTPFTNYRLSFEVKAYENNPWSEAASTEVLTLEDQPLDGPPMTDTSYYAKDCVSNMKDVMVYWKDPQKKSLRGKLTKFEVVVGNKSEQLRQSFNFYLTSLQCDTEHEILVYSATEVGLSITPSKMIIPIEELPKVNSVTVRIETNATSESQNAVVTWDPGSMRGENITLIFYMCGETNLPNTCFDDYRTWEVSIDCGQLKLRSLPSSAVLFGYALRNGRGQKRGIEWASCVYYTNRLPEKLSNFMVKYQASALIISWNYRKCDQNTKILILRYHLFICPGVVKNVTDSCFTVTVESSEQTYLAKDLEGGRPYSVFMKAQSPAGFGHLSDPVVGVPDVENNSSSSMRNVIIGMVVLAILLFILSLAAVCIWYKCRSSKEKIKNYGGIVQQLFENDDSKKSGIDTKNSPHLSSLKSHHNQHPLPARLQVVASQPDNLTITEEVSANKTQPNHVNENTDSPTSVQPDTSNACSVSNGTIPYMKVTNVGMNPLSHLHNNGISEENTIDEGYHSPEARNDIPNFVQNTQENPPQTKISFMSQIPLPNQFVHVCNVTSESRNFQSDVPSHIESSTTSFSDGYKGSEHAINHSLYRDQITGQCIISAESTRENSSSLENDNNSSCIEILPVYVTCGLDEDINVATRNSLNCGTLSQQTVNIQTALIDSMREQQSSDITDQRKDCEAGYKDFHFIENSPSAESVTHGGNEVSAEINGSDDGSGVFLNRIIEVQKTDYLSQGIENISQGVGYVKQGAADVRQKLDYVSVEESHLSQAADNVSQTADYVGQGNDNINQELDYVRQGLDIISERDGYARQQADYVSQVDAHDSQGADYDRQEADSVSQGNDHVSQEEAYVSQGSSHVSQGNDHVSQGGDHVSQEEAYVSQGSSHVSQGNDHVSQEEAYVSQGNSHVSQGNDHVSQGNSHVSQEEAYVSQGNGHLSQEEAYVSQGNGHASQGTDYVTQEASSAGQETDGVLEGSNYVKQAFMDSCSNHSNETVSQSLESTENNRLQYHQVGPSVHHLASEGDYQSSTDFRTSLAESQNMSIPVTECTAYSDLSGEQQLQMLASVGPSVFLTVNGPPFSEDKHQNVGNIKGNCIC